MAPTRTRGTSIGCQSVLVWILAGLGAVAVSALPQSAIAQRGERPLSIAQTPAPAGAATESPAGAPQPPEPAPITPPPATIPSTRAPVFPSLTGPGIQPAATFELHPSISLTEEYTDNFNLAHRDKQENFRSTVSPGLILGINGVFLKGSLGYTLSATHDTSDDEFNLFHALAGQISWQATPLLTLTASDALTRSDQAAQADQLGLRRERRPFIGNTFSLSSDYRATTFAARGYYQLATFFDEGRADTISHTLGASASTSFYQTNTASIGYEFLKSGTSQGGADTDITGHRVNASVARQLNPQAAVGVSGSYAWREETGRVGTPDDNFTIGSVSVFGAYQVPGIWSISASLGYSRLDSDRRGSDSSPIGSATLSYLLARAVLSLSADAGFSESFASGQNFGVVKTFGVQGSLSYPLTPFITGTGTGYYHRNEFSGVADAVAGTQPGQTEDSYGGSVSVSIQLVRWLTLALEYAHTVATSSAPDRDYTENRVRASLNGTF